MRIHFSSKSKNRHILFCSGELLIQPSNFESKCRKTKTSSEFSLSFFITENKKKPRWLSETARATSKLQITKMITHSPLLKMRNNVDRYRNLRRPTVNLWLFFCEKKFCLSYGKLFVILEGLECLLFLFRYPNIGIF